MNGIERLVQRIRDLSPGYSEQREQAVARVLHPDNVRFFRRIVETGTWENVGGKPGLNELIVIKLHPLAIMGVVFAIQAAIESLWTEDAAAANLEPAIPVVPELPANSINERNRIVREIIRSRNGFRDRARVLELAQSLDSVKIKYAIRRGPLHGKTESKSFTETAKLPSTHLEYRRVFGANGPLARRAFSKK